MAATKQLYTIDYAAKILGVSVDVLDELTMTMTPEDGVLHVRNGTDCSLVVFTEIALDDAADQLRDPNIRQEFERLAAMSYSPVVFTE